MNKLLIILSILGLSGCWQSITSDDLKVAYDFCKDNDGIYSITEYMEGNTQVYCNNDETTYVDTHIKTIAIISLDENN